MLEMLKELTVLKGVSSNEDAVREYIIKKIKSYQNITYKVDALGNIIAEKKGKERAKQKIMISAHMDEVGLIITNVTDEGFLKFAPVGGIDPRVILGRRVIVGEKDILGVIGTKAVHLQDDDERKQAPAFDKLLIDIGVSSKAEALKQINLGDTAVFDSDYVEFGDGFIKAKAIDDRVGCSIILKLLSKDVPYDFTAAFLVQEEIGTRGAKTAAFAVEPEVAIVIEATTAADVAFVPKEKKVCYLSKGPVVSFMDNGTVYNRELYNLAFKLSQEKNIPCQTKLAVAGGNDARSIHTSKSGVKTLAVSLPCRYLHSPSCVIKKEDAENTLLLVDAIYENVAKSIC